jgi:gamma-glutamylcyclotransferase (GGCT)/AIG2-like uncharacterized protein YtfP
MAGFVPNDVNNKVKQVFVYGTLRKGGNNRHWVSEFIDDDISPITGTMIQGEMYHYDPNAEGGTGAFPYLVERAGTDTSTIVGELLTFHESDWEGALRSLDTLESCPDFYYRRVKDVTLDGDGTTTQAWVYFIQPLKKSRGRLIKSGDWIKDKER